MIPLALFALLAWQSASVRLGERRWSFALSSSPAPQVVISTWIMAQVIPFCNGTDKDGCAAGFARVMAVPSVQIPNSCYVSTVAISCTGCFTTIDGVVICGR